MGQGWVEQRVTTVRTVVNKYRLDSFLMGRSEGRILFSNQRERE